MNSSVSLVPKLKNDTKQGERAGGSVGGNPGGGGPCRRMTRACESHRQSLFIDDERGSKQRQNLNFSG